MIELQLGSQESKPKSILLLGAHCDDIEIGCGGTILELITKHPDLHVYWVVFSSNVQREKEARKSAESTLAGVKKRNIQIKEFRNGYFPYIGAQIKNYFEELKKEVNPDIIFSHYKEDFHQDHRTISELTWNTFRDHLILEYEIPKYDGDLGRPNMYYTVDEKTCEAKINNLLDCFESQHNKPWFEKELFYSLLRLRGMECQSKTNYAEAFYCRKQAMCF